MEIRFSTRVAHPLHCVAQTVREKSFCEQVTSVRRRTIRFDILTWGGSSCPSDDYDRVIRALLTLDPDATVRTARAVYEGLEDFNRQFNARGGK